MKMVKESNLKKELVKFALWFIENKNTDAMDSDKETAVRVVEEYFLVGGT